MTSGKQSGISLERYVLGALLDEVLTAANLRLAIMSRRRYSLQRSTTWEDKRVKQIGLDIEVFDQYTGCARPANTLSGGESFLASTALALGLADTVQAYGQRNIGYGIERTEFSARKRSFSGDYFPCIRIAGTYYDTTSCQ